MDTLLVKKVVWLLRATAPVDTAQVPRLAEKYTSEWARLYGSECATVSNAYPKSSH